MRISKALCVTTRHDWRAWLEEHHQTETEVWLIYYKKHTGQPRIPYDDAVEEALCFGWIDSTVQRIDDCKFAQKFTPRKDNSKGSALNLKRVRKLIKEGRMTEAGLAKINPAVIKQKSKPEQSRSQLAVPPFMEQALRANRRAWQNFNNLAPSYREQYIGWIGDAKKEETRQRRLREAMALLEQNRKLGMK